VESRRDLITHSAAKCPTTDPCVIDSTQSLDLRVPLAKTWKDELWLGFQDLSRQSSAQNIPGSEQPYRIVRIKEGCTYKSFHDQFLGL
jgi:hypothetical protein